MIFFYSINISTIESSLLNKIMDNQYIINYNINNEKILFSKYLYSDVEYKENDIKDIFESFFVGMGGGGRSSRRCSSPAWAGPPVRATSTGR